MLGLRIAAALIDLAVLTALFLVLSVLMGGGNRGDAVMDTAGFWVYLALLFAYYAVLESTLGRTVGKLVVGLHIVGWNGRRPSPVAVTIRTILRIVDWLPVFYVVGFGAMLVTGARRQRLGDLVAETHVERTPPMRHRGAATALLASVLVVAFAVSAAPSVLLDRLAPMSWSSACVNQRCNVTARGDQVLDLSDGNIYVSAIRAGSARFTVDGEQVVLRVGETRRVGHSLVHLASVDADVAKFSVDFSGLFVDRSDLVNGLGGDVRADAPQAIGGATDDASLARIATVRAEIDDRIAGTDSELTSSVLDEMASAMRACTRELASDRSTSAEFPSIQDLVDKACGEYDKGAECLAVAADIDMGVVAGSEADRRLTAALDCGFDAMNRGGELLVDAEIKADEVRSAPR